MKIFTLLVTVFFLILVFLGCQDPERTVSDTPSSFYISIGNGNDKNDGSIENPFLTIDKALNVVKQRVDRGIKSDKIYLRGGRYKKASDTTLYRLELKGTPDDYALLSAMPCEPNAPGCVQRKSGQWYEDVVIDDAHVVATPWEKVPGKDNIWKTNPGYTKLEWTHQNLWPWTRTPNGFPITDKDDTPETTLFTVAPYMLLQDGEPTIWEDYVDSLKYPGSRTYDHTTGTLYLRPFENKNPNDCLIETWYGGPEPYEVGTLHLDGEGRALFNGNLEYAAIKGFEFYMFNKIFEFHRLKYHSESEREIQRHVLLEDLFYRYGWMHILLDSDLTLYSAEGVIRTRYHDRSHWTARNNVYYRPSRECFQLHGDNHIFEYNDIIEHLGPWAGPAACVSAVNTRNTRNALIRNNYIVGHGKNRYRTGSVFMIEMTGGKHHSDSGNYILGGQTYENNIFVDNAGPIMVLGKGVTRMRNITVRNNIFKSTRGDAAIRISSPHLNLIIENNIFYDQNQGIAIPTGSFIEDYRSRPSSISIRNNIFALNKKTIDQNLLIPGENSNLYVENNLFYQNEQPPIGKNPVVQDPKFRSPEKLDFRSVASTAKGEYNYYGPYPNDGSFVPGTDWWSRPNQKSLILLSGASD
jgi:hypothetical protein